MIKKQISVVNMPYLVMFSLAQLSLIQAVLAMGCEVEQRKTGLAAVTEVLPHVISNPLPESCAEYNIVRMHVVVHGSYDVQHALRNPWKVKNDHDLAHSAHELAVREHSRKQEKTYDRSVMYHEGLYRFNPEAPTWNTDLAQMAIAPFLSSYHLLQEHLNLNNPNEKVLNLYYSGGWSGLLSQGARRLGGLALFNAITTEKRNIIQALEQQKSTAKIETVVIAHSHGGNAVLNTAWLDRKDCLEEVYEAFKACEEMSSLEKTYPKWVELDQVLSSPESVKALQAPQYNMNKWLYSPTLTNPSGPLIDVLVMFGTPIQGETYPLATCKTFGRIINVYSDGDRVQDGDKFSTWKGFSLKLIPQLILTKIRYQAQAKDSCLHANIAQVKIALAPLKKDESAAKVAMITPDVTPTGNQAVVDKAPEIMPVAQGPRSMSALGEMIAAGGAQSQSLEGPAHLEFWLIIWQGKTQRLCVRPAPIALFSPLIMNYAQDGDTVYFEQDEEGLLSLKKKGVNGNGQNTLTTLPKRLVVKMQKEFFKFRYQLNAADIHEEENGLSQRFQQWLYRNLLTS